MKSDSAIIPREQGPNRDMLYSAPQRCTVASHSCCRPQGSCDTVVVARLYMNLVIAVNMTTALIMCTIGATRVQLPFKMSPKAHCESALKCKVTVNAERPPEQRSMVFVCY